MNYSVNLSAKANDKIRFWVDKADKEVSGFGMVEYDDAKKEFTVTDAYLIEQTVGAAHTDISPEGMAKLMYATRLEKGHLGFWWHSHVKMDVFWSGTDMDTILKLGSNGWIVASVFNKKEEVRTAVAYVASSALNKNKPETIFYDDLTTYIVRPEMDKALSDELEKQYKELVKPEPTKIWPMGQGEFMARNGFGRRGEADLYAAERGMYTGYDEIDRIATGNIIDASNSREVRDYNEGYFDMQGEPLTEKELDQLCAKDGCGAFGFGFAVEAKILNLTHKTYRRILKGNNMSQILNLEDRLIKAEAEGNVKTVVSRLFKSESGQ